MKKWLALLLCCLLCLCAVGAMAEETVTLNLSEGFVYQIYPDGYWKGSRVGGAFVPEEDFQSHTGPYVITGTSTGLDTCLDFYSIPHKAPQNTEPVTYTVTFRDACIYAGWNECTAIRFGNGEGDGAKDITLNLINIGTSVVKPAYNHAVFSNQSINKNSVTVNIHNTSGSSLDLFGGWDVVQHQGVSGVAGTNVTVKFKDTTSSHSDIVGRWIIKDPCGEITSCSARPATCTSNGITQHWTCDTCNMLFTDENGLQATTLSAVTIPKLGHMPSLVPAKSATCTEEGNIEYYRCTRDGCGELFSDEQGQTPFTGDKVIKKLGHKLTPVPAKAPTCTEDGYEAYYACARCQELFADENATMPLPQPKPIPAEGHDFGEDWQSDGEKHWHACDCGERSGEAEHSFVTVVDRKPGETEPGEQHEECSVCGYRKAAVSIPAVGRIDLPQTGDSSHLLGWAALFGACCAGLWCLNRRRG